MAYWLLKSEPDEFSYADLVRDGRSVWDGVRNPVALKHMRNVQPGDRAFIYHTGKERAIVGVARIETAAYPDPEAGDEKIVVFDLKPEKRLEKPVTLASLKQREDLSGWELVRLPRLSVMPVPEEIWSSILQMSRA